MYIFYMDIPSYRKTHNLSVEDFAQMIGVKPPTVYAYEAGSRRPSFDRMHVIQIVTNKEISFSDFVASSTPSTKKRKGKNA